MWYRLAQENLDKVTNQRMPIVRHKELRSEIRKDPNGISITFYSPIINYKNLREYYQEYPNIRIYLKKPKDLKNTKVSDGFRHDFNIQPSEVSNILKTVQKILAKYSPGFLNEGTLIEVVAEIGGTRLIKPAGYASVEGESRIVIDYNYLEHALDHEIGHTMEKDVELGEKKNLPKLSPTLYGRTNSREAYAEAFEILAKKGWNFRFPPTSEQNIKVNKLLDYVYEQHKNYLVPNSDNLNFLPNNLQRNRHMPFSIESNTMSNDLDNARFGRIVGAIQHAIDKYSGDKNSYAKSLLADRKKINEILKYVNGLTFFSNSPATEKEIDLAIKTIKISLDKKKDPGIISIDGNTIRKKTVDNPNTSMSNHYLPRKMKDYMDQVITQSKNGIKSLNSYIGRLFEPETASLKEDLSNPLQIEYKEPNPKNFNEWMNPISELTKEKLKNIPKVSIYDELVPVDEQEYKIGQFILSKSNANYVNDSFEIENLANNLIKQIFPPLTYNNPEEYLYYDFHLDSSGDYSLDTNAVEQKINNAINTSEFTKKMNDAQKKKIAYELRTRINRVKDSHTNILNKTIEEGDVFGDSYLFPGGKFRNIGSNINVAKQAVDKLFTAKIPRRNLLFMRIYNNTGISEKQKQELLNYYKTKQAQVVRK
jgi:hypothetical protein